MKDERGYIVVETILGFVPFVIVTAFILSLAQIVALESRVHYALAQAAEEISVHSYVAKLKADGADLGSVSEFVSRVNGLFSGPGSLTIGDEMIRGIVGYAEGIGGDQIMDVFGRYLSGPEPLDMYLKRMNVLDGTRGFDFSSSDTASGSITIKVEYKISLPFMAAFGADFMAFPVVQAVSTKSWAQGNGEGYVLGSGGGGGGGSW